MAITNISFANFLCLLLCGFFALHTLTRSADFEEVQEVPNNAEINYCKLPQSYDHKPVSKCLSIQATLLLVGRSCTTDNRHPSVDRNPRGPRPRRNDSRRTVEEAVEEVADEEVAHEEVAHEEVAHEEVAHEEVAHEEVAHEEDNYKEVVKIEVGEVNERGDEKKETKEEVGSSLVYSFVISLLLCSSIISLLEWLKEKTKGTDKNVGEENAMTGEGEAASSRRISLADLTVNRHIRRRDSQQYMDVMRQSAAGSKPPPLIRRSSFPAQFPEVRPRHPFQRQQSHPAIPSPFVRRMSMDLSEDDSSPDRRRVRIIRRH